jgi:hypothetical protein
MADAKFIDFDAALTEAERAPVVVRFQGRDWELYPALPAKPLLRLMRLHAGDGDGDLSRGEMVDLLASLVPPTVFDAWLDGGLTIDQLARLIKMLMSAYGMGTVPGEGGDEGEAVGPTGPTSTPSSSTGLS